MSLTKLDIIRKSKSVFMKWKLHGIVEPFTGFFLNAYYMSKLSKWRSTTKVNGYNDWYQSKWEYTRRYNLYEKISSMETLDSPAIDYFEFGVSGGHSFKWWLEHNKNPGSKFYGFDTFEGLMIQGQLFIRDFSRIRWFLFWINIKVSGRS
jgi:hypothetical protein